MADDTEALKARLAELEAENARLKQQGDRLRPSLRSRVSIQQLFTNPNKYLGTVVGVGGWIRTARVAGGGRFGFVKLYDGTLNAEVQVVVNASDPNFDAVMKGSTGASLFVTGEVVPSKGAEQRFEIEAQTVRILGLCNAETFPLAKKAHSLEYLRGIGHMRPRSGVIGAVTRIRNALAFATHRFFQEQGYIYLHTPLITAADCEGGGEMFQVTTLIENGKFKHLQPDGSADYTRDFFKRPSYLTVSGQLNGEIYACALSNIYTFGPTFRAEDSHTTRHLAEFWMIEPEIAFADLQENMSVAEAYIKYTLKYALETCPTDMALLEAYEQEGRAQGKEEEEKQRASDAKAKKEADKKANKEKQLAAKAKAAEAAAAGGDAAQPAAPAEAPAAGAPAEVPPQDPAPAGGEAGGAKKEEGSKEGAKKDGAKEAAAGKKKKEKKAAPVVEAADWREVPLRERLHRIIDVDFARVTYTEAIDILLKAQAAGHKFEEEKIHWGIDMHCGHERYLCERHFKRPTIVTNYPKEIKAFYMRLDDDGRTVSAMDVLVPGVGELVGGSQREERFEVLEARMKEKGLKVEDYGWYLDLRRYGSVPHAGFGLGFERLVCYTTGMDNIRDVIPFPRYPGHAEY